MLNMSAEEEDEGKERTLSSTDNRKSEKIRPSTSGGGYMDDFVIVQRSISKNHQSSALIYIPDDLQSQSSKNSDDFNLARRSS